MVTPQRADEQEPASPPMPSELADGDRAHEPPLRSTLKADVRRRRGDPLEPVVWKPRRQIASWALTCSMFGLSMSWFMPWAMPASLLGVIIGGIALSRSWEEKAVAGWGLGLGLAGTISSGFWAVWMLMRLGILVF